MAVRSLEKSPPDGCGKRRDSGNVYTIWQLASGANFQLIYYKAHTSAKLYAWMKTTRRAPYNLLTIGQSLKNQNKIIN